MPSKKITAEQHEKQLAGIAAELERRKAAGNAGRQKSLSGHINDLVSKSLENIKHVVEGTAEIDKTRYDASKWVITQKQAIDKHAHELKKLKWAAKKAEAEADAGGYGDNSPEALKKKAEENGGKPKLSTAYNPEWDAQRKITDDIPDDEDYEELEDE